MNSQYAIAVHILSLIGLYPQYARTSEEMANSVGVNPVIIRTVAGKLREAGLLHTQRGVPGAKLTRPPQDITLLDIYQAVDAPEFIFKLHDQPNPACPVGSNIQASLNSVLHGAQQAMEAHLAQTTLADVTRDLAARVV